MEDWTPYFEIYGLNETFRKIVEGQKKYLAEWYQQPHLPTDKYFIWCIEQPFSAIEVLYEAVHAILNDEPYTMVNGQAQAYKEP